MKSQPQKLLAIVPARGGSQSIPQKNIALLNGKALITYTLAAALGAEDIDTLLISSDDPAIIHCCQNFLTEHPHSATVEFPPRPAALSQNSTPIIPLLLHILIPLRQTYQSFILLQPTSPLRTNSDINAAIKTFTAANADALISVRAAPAAAYKYFKLVPANTAAPATANKPVHTLKGMVNDDAPFCNRQSIPPLYAATGAIYMANLKLFLAHKSFLLPKTIPFNMPAERSLDIDTHRELQQAEKIFKPQAPRQH